MIYFIGDKVKVKDQDIRGYIVEKFDNKIIIEDQDSEYAAPDNRLEYRVSEVEPMPEMWFCLNSDGELYILGDHGDFEAAEDTAKSMGLDPIWTFGEASARQWRSVLNNQESRLGGEE